MVVICPVSLDCTIYVLGVFAIEICRLIGTCICLLLDITPRQLAENSFAWLLLKFKTPFKMFILIITLFAPVFARDRGWPGKVWSSCCNRHLRTPPALRARAAHCGTDWPLGAPRWPSDHQHGMAGYAWLGRWGGTHRLGVWTQLWS